ncbi:MULTISPECIES: alpha/beta fold hydrolase [Clostridium]|uniref:alpha/beta fold hydrolase n=1 Tax=Clostridium TaxID=1485 RepID=UPI0008245479|nr:MULTISPECIES: alpha/beta hydrolase [Clostridium]PJI08606.1 alpha/beta hydrolase [Clostridium sp. CT7]
MKLKIKNAYINYEIVGSGIPIIMIHGYYADHRLMMGCMESIFKHKEKYKRIYVDLPGMGKSDSAEWINNSDDMLQAVENFIDEVIPGENFLLVGESYGGYISRGLVYKMADRIDGIAMICPIIIPNFKNRNVPQHTVLIKDKEVLSKLKVEDAEDFNSTMVVQNKKIYNRYRNEIIAGFEAADHEFLQSIMQNGYGFSFDVDKLDKKFDEPALILSGRQDSCAGYKDTWSILENFPRATFAVVDMAGHNMQIEKEEVFNLLVEEWLKSVRDI